MTMGSSLKTLTSNESIILAPKTSHIFSMSFKVNPKLTPVVSYNNSPERKTNYLNEFVMIDRAFENIEFNSNNNSH